MDLTKLYKPGLLTAQEKLLCEKLRQILNSAHDNDSQGNLNNNSTEPPGLTKSPVRSLCNSPVGPKCKVGTHLSPLDTPACQRSCDFNTLATPEYQIPQSKLELTPGNLQNQNKNNTTHSNLAMCKQSQNTPIKVKKDTQTTKIKTPVNPTLKEEETQIKIHKWSAEITLRW